MWFIISWINRSIELINVFFLFVIRKKVTGFRRIFFPLWWVLFLTSIIDRLIFVCVCVCGNFSKFTWKIIILFVAFRFHAITHIWQDWWPFCKFREKKTDVNLVWKIPEKKRNFLVYVCYSIRSIIRTISSQFFFVFTVFLDENSNFSFFSYQWNGFLIRICNSLKWKRIDFCSSILVVPAKKKIGFNEWVMLWTTTVIWLWNKKKFKNDF